MVDVCAYAGSVHELVFICVFNSKKKCYVQFKSLKFHWSLKLLVFVNFAGTGNVLKVQHLLHVCSEHDDSKDQVWTETLLICLIVNFYQLNQLDFSNISSTLSKLFFIVQQDNNEKKDDKKKDKDKKEETPNADLSMQQGRFWFLTCWNTLYLPMHTPHFYVKPSTRNL